MTTKKLTLLLMSVIITMLTQQMPAQVSSISVFTFADGSGYGLLNNDIDYESIMFQTGDFIAGDILSNPGIDINDPAVQQAIDYARNKVPPAVLTDYDGELRGNNLNPSNGNINSATKSVENSNTTGSETSGNVGGSLGMDGVGVSGGYSQSNSQSNSQTSGQSKTTESPTSVEIHVRPTNDADGKPDPSKPLTVEYKFIKDGKSVADGNKPMPSGLTPNDVHKHHEDYQNNKNNPGSPSGGGSSSGGSTGGGSSTGGYNGGFTFGSWYMGSESGTQYSVYGANGLYLGYVTYDGDGGIVSTLSTAAQALGVTMDQLLAAVREYLEKLRGE